MLVRGFSLIELMIVVSIIAILLAVGIPAYQDYSIRTRVSEGLKMADVAKVAVSESVDATGILPNNDAQAGYGGATATSNVASIAVGANGVITITYTAAAGGGTLLLTPTLQASGEITWDCSGGTTLSSYRPASCR